ncbi:cellulose biosynthesis protein BcsD [Phenylobacterium sp.]|jgi:hypothetical protein|uniref:cellulose biosynthesis protein BcsD n=1 Tax=Phenylobacterium sp. TaxID=1871053 RepID=UPI0035B18ECA
MQTPDDPRLAYYAERQVAPQWRGFLAALAGELFENVGAEASRGFLRQMGERMARAAPLPPAETLGDLSRLTNARLAEMDWGLAAFEDHGQALVIRHEAGPWRIAEDAEGPWPAAFAAVLEGLYSGWLRHQGAGASLAARLDLEASEDAVVLSFGRLP